MRRDGARWKNKKEDLQMRRDGAEAHPQCAGMAPGGKTRRKTFKCTGMAQRPTLSGQTRMPAKLQRAAQIGGLESGSFWSGLAEGWSDSSGAKSSQGVPPYRSLPRILKISPWET